MSKPTLLAQDARALKYIKEGVDVIYGAVKRTLGPEPLTTLMYRTFNRGPRNVDDGFYTAEVIVPKNPFIRLAAEFFKEAVMRTNRRVGDGTSTTAVIGGVLFNDLYKLLSAVSSKIRTGTQPQKVGAKTLSKRVLAEAAMVKEQIRAASQPVETLEELERIARISLGDETHAKEIAKIAFEVGVDGFIDVVEGYKGEVEIDRVEGMRFPAKIPAKSFVNVPGKYEMVAQDCPVFITNMALDNVNQAVAIVNGITDKIPKVILIAPSFSNPVLEEFFKAMFSFDAQGNRFKTGVDIFPVAVPSMRTEQLEDLAAYCDATLLDKQGGKKADDVQIKFGFMEKLIVKDAETREDAIATGGRGAKGDAVTERIKVLKGQLAETKTDDMGSAFRKLLERRIASMASAGGVIRVGAPTDAESLPLKLKIEDVVYACRAALRSGYVKGGGLALKEIAEGLADDSLLKNALMAPYKQIQENAGGELEIGEDVIDPTDAVYYAVEHATSVVASLITVGNLIPEEPELQPGEGEMAMARAVEKVLFVWAKEKNILSENEREMLLDAQGRMTSDEWGYTHQD